MTTPNYNRSYRERYVAFIDMLGFSEHIKNSIRDRALFRTLRGVLSSRVLTVDCNSPDSITAYHFSDSIVISTKYDSQGFEDLIRSVRLCCYDLFLYRILTRGGITKGKICEDGRAVFGPSLIRAYNIEKDIAQYPRIVMDSCVYREMSRSSFKKNKAFRKDFDGLYHLDILELGPVLEGNIDFDVGYGKPPLIASDKEQWLQIIKQFIEEGIERHQDKTSVAKKYVWMAKYFNSFLRKSKYPNITEIGHRLLTELVICEQ